VGPKSAALKDAHRLLENCVLFSGLDAEERAAIAAQARIRTFEANETVFNLGSPGDHMMARNWC
jgi:CRP-like cAMP-binding protein